MKIAKTCLPETSILSNQQNDYSDSFKAIIPDPENQIAIDDIAKAFFLSAPKWVEKLMKIRDSLVGFLGLKTTSKLGSRDEILANIKCKVGDQLGLFKVFYKTANEVVLGENDKHLNFRVSLLYESNSDFPDAKNVIITTTVKFNNLFGKLYFLPVKPIHGLIVPAMLRGTVKQLELILIERNGENKSSSILSQQPPL